MTSGLNELQKHAGTERKARKRQNAATNEANRKRKEGKQ